MIQFINYLLDLLEALVVQVVDLLPDSPFQNIDLGVLEQYISYVNYFYPVKQLVIFLGLYTSAVIIWYGFRWVLRLARYIE